MPGGQSPPAISAGRQVPRDERSVIETTRRSFTVRIIYSDLTDTVYMYIERYLVALDDQPHTPALLRRLMSLNWDLVGAKFEWNPEDGEVRLAWAMNTDSNFDRRAFRSLARGITAVADRFHRELDRINRGQ